MLSVAESRADSSQGRTTRKFESPLELLLVATACSFPTRLLQPLVRRSSTSRSHLLMLR